MAFADKVEAIEAADNATDEDDDVLAVKSKSRAEEMPAACCRLATTVAQPAIRVQYQSATTTMTTTAGSPK